ncbi:MAG: hypothetical protein RMN52_14635 [Anaerolineae bacterium]|nr:hypothetical protein [Candidatus Roseilinea sp.]MDW8451234.1 hypothetical protein [Anaerolineae bacterium]
MDKAAMTERLERVFPPEQAGVLAGVIYDAYEPLVKASDFNELKAIVAELAEAQKQTDRRLAELAASQQELAASQRELAEAQKRTEDRLGRLVTVVEGLALEVGGLSRAASYALENEAYRMLPGLLQGRFGLELLQRFVRTEINGEEINLFGRARRNGHIVLIVGETKLQVAERRARRAERRRVLDQLERKVEAVRRAYPGQEIMPILITHYARPAFLQEAEARGVTVIQSFEW